MVSRHLAAPQNPTPAGFTFCPSPLGLPHGQAATSVPATCSESPKEPCQRHSRQAGSEGGDIPSMSHPQGFALCTHCFQWPQKAPGLRQPPALQHSRRHLQPCVTRQWLRACAISLYSLIQRSKDSCLCLKLYLWTLELSTYGQLFL